MDGNAESNTPPEQEVASVTEVSNNWLKNSLKNNQAVKITTALLSAGLGGEVLREQTQEVGLALSQNNYTEAATRGLISAGLATAGAVALVKFLRPNSSNG